MRPESRIKWAGQDLNLQGLIVHSDLNATRLPITPPAQLLLLYHYSHKLACHMNQIQSLYHQFISIFPPTIQTLVSIGLFIGLVVILLDLVKRNFIWLLLLILFVPAAIPILKNISDNLLVFLKILLP